MQEAPRQRTVLRRRLCAPLMGRPPIYQGPRQARPGLLRLLEAPPLLHELVLPDRNKESNLLNFLCYIMEQCAHSTPRLRTVIFNGNCLESLW